MAKKNKEIRDQFVFFNKLLNDLKIVNDNPIVLQPKRNNVYWVVGDSGMTSNTIVKDVKFIIERSKRDNKYGIKLRCQDLTNEPFFRFDSDGPAHRNDDPRIPLEEQLITTPHFNSYSEDGSAIAYKNEALKQGNNSKIIANSIEFGISLFCMETNCQLSDGNYPITIDKEPEIKFDEKLTINFDDITFD